MGTAAVNGRDASHVIWQHAFPRPSFLVGGGGGGLFFGIVHMHLVIPRNAQLILLLTVLHGVLAVERACVT